jgi:methyl-accepting chemotaxis protein
MRVHQSPHLRVVPKRTLTAIKPVFLVTNHGISALTHSAGAADCRGNKIYLHSLCEAILTTDNRPSISAQLGINPSDLDARKAWNVFTRDNVEVLKDLSQLANDNADEIARKFYDHSFSFPAFVAKIQEAGGTRQGLEAAQSQYFKDLFNGNYDMTYAERRLFVGSLHHRLGISPRYYLGSYIQFYEHLFPIQAKKYSNKADKVVPAIMAFLKITNFDQQLMLEAYTLGFVNEMSDQVADVRQQAVTMETNTEAMGQLATGATEQASNSQEAAGNVQQLGEAISTVSQASETQAKAADGMTSMIEDLKVAISQINTPVESEIQTAETASTTSKKGADVVSQTVEGMDRISASVRDGSDLIGVHGVHRVTALR